jgi:hypothetical protein
MPKLTFEKTKAAVSKLAKNPAKSTFGKTCGVIEPWMAKASRQKTCHLE